MQPDLWDEKPGTVSVGQGLLLLEETFKTDLYQRLMV